MSPPAGDCPLSHCCRWRELCSPQIPRVFPGREYVSVPADADNSPAWSVLVGIMATSGGSRSLRLHRFRVARSGRVLCGGSLEMLGDDYYKAEIPKSHVRAATATLSPGGRSLSLCFFSREIDFSDPVSKIAPPIPLQMLVDVGGDNGRGITVSRLPGLPPEVGPLMPICPISAAGDIWAPYLTEVYGQSSLVMLCMDKAAGKWVKVGTLELKRPPLSGDMLDDFIPALQGHVVVGETILLSLWPFHHFYTFNCNTRAWAKVVTTREECMYVPIREHGVYVEEDDAIYFLSGAVVYFYKLFKDTQNRCRMAPPTEVSLLCPFSSEGYGFLSYLGGRVMCSVWIGVRLPCHCGTKHVLITTFRVKGDKGVEVLHSTCRQLDMVPSKPVESYLEFSFLQEYEEFDHERVTPTAKLRENAMVSSTPPDDMEIPASSNVGKSSSMLACCREFLNGTPLSGTVMLQRSAIRSNRTLYIICQAASRSTVYEINILDGRLACHDKTLTPHCILETPMPHFEDAIEGDILYLLDRPWHFLCDSRSIYAVPSVEDKIYSCRFNQGISSRFNRGIINHIDSTWPIGVAFRLVVRLGIKLVAISDTLRDVYHFFEGMWMHHETFGPPGLDTEVSLSGYVVLSPTTFMVSDAKTNRCFLYDLFFDSWSLVMPFVESELLPSDWPRMAFLSDRCVFAKGFIYTCSHGGLAAYELVQQADSYYLGERVDLKLSWCKYWERYQMCLEYIGEDTNSGAIMFCVMKGDYISQPGYPYNEGPIRITTVQVKTEEMPNGKLKPKTIGHVDIGTAFVESSGGSTWTRDCFADACY